MQQLATTTYNARVGAGPSTRGIAKNGTYRFPVTREQYEAAKNRVCFLTVSSVRLSFFLLSSHPYPLPFYSLLLFHCGPPVMETIESTYPTEVGTLLRREVRPVRGEAGILEVEVGHSRGK